MAYHLNQRLIRKGGLIFPSDIESLVESVKDSQNLYSAISLKQSMHYGSMLPFGTIITLDGLSGAGKTTVGQSLASFYSVPLLESGYIFKALAKRSENLGFSQYSSDECLIYAVDSLNLSDIMDPELDDIKYSVLAPSYATKSKKLRYNIKAKLKQIAFDIGSLIVTGRDAGQSLFPQGSPNCIFLDVDDKSAAFRKIIQSENIINPVIVEKATKARNKADLVNLNMNKNSFYINTSQMSEKDVSLRCIHYIQNNLIKSSIKDTMILKNYPKFKL